MNTHFYLLTASLALACSTVCFAADAPGGAGVTIKCWVNESGVKECGSVVPPEYASQGHKVLNLQGDVMQQVGREKSPEERNQLLAEEQRKLKEERLRTEQEAQDKKLLDLYPSESDILIARDGKLASVDAAIRVAQDQLDFYRRSLEEAEKTIARDDIKKSKDEYERLNRHTTNLKQQITRFEKMVVTKNQEQEDIKQEYQGYLLRYQEIKRRLRNERFNPPKETPDAASTDKPAP